jgi:hypothetical protein
MISISICMGSGFVCVDSAFLQTMVQKYRASFQVQNKLPHSAQQAKQK